MWQFILDHKVEIWAVVVSALLVLSEYLGQNPNIAANNIFQLVVGFLRKQQPPK